MYGNPLLNGYFYLACLGLSGSKMVVLGIKLMILNHGNIHICTIFINFKKEIRQIIKTFQSILYKSLLMKIFKVIKLE
jgi:hypothetical protein